DGAAPLPAPAGQGPPSPRASRPPQGEDALSRARNRPEGRHDRRHLPEVIAGAEQVVVDRVRDRAGHQEHVRPGLGTMPVLLPGAGPAKLPVESPDHFPDGRECVETPPVAEIEIRLRPHPRCRQGRGGARRAAVVARKEDAGSSRKHLRNRLRRTCLHAVLLWLTAPGSSGKTRRSSPGLDSSRASTTGSTPGGSVSTPSPG